MRRREFLTLVGGAAAAWSGTARAQQAAMPVIGFLNSGSPEPYAKRLDAFLKGLREGGFVPGKNVAIEYRWGAGQTEKLPVMAADLIGRRVAVIATAGSTPATVAASKATTTIPIVFAIGADPVKLGIVASLARPGRNVTGVTSQNANLSAKRLQLLGELVPQAAHYFMLANPTSQLGAQFIESMQNGAASLGIHIEILRASSDAEIEAAFAALPQQPGTVLAVSPDPLFYSRRARIAALAQNHAVPTMFDDREYVVAGGLAGYGADWLNVMQMAGNYTARILNGEKPADLPVVQAAKFDMAINLKTAKALGLTVPQLLLARADEVIE